LFFVESIGYEKRERERERDNANKDKSVVGCSDGGWSMESEAGA
jgi:hypothetical protein